MKKEYFVTAGWFMVYLIQYKNNKDVFQIKSVQTHAVLRVKSEML